MYKIFILEELAGKIKLNLDCSFQIQFTTGLKAIKLNLLAPKQPKTKPSQNTNKQKPGRKWIACQDQATLVPWKVSWVYRF